LRQWSPLLVSLLLIAEYGHNRFLVAGTVVAKELISLKGDDEVFSPAMVIWVPLYFSFSFMTNLLVTFLIGLRLWRVSRAVASLRTRGRSLRTVAILTVRGGTTIEFLKLTMTVEIGISCPISNRQSHYLDPIRTQR